MTGPVTTAVAVGTHRGGAVRLVLTLEQRGAATREVVVDADDEAHVADLAEAIGARVLLDGPGPLDPARALAGAGLLHGTALGLGTAPAATGVEPGGLVEVRVVSGPGTGRVVRLGAGEYDLGRDVLPENGEADGVRLRVAAAGRVGLDPGPHRVRLEQVEVEGPVDWAEAGQLAVGRSLVELHRVVAADAPLTPGRTAGTLDLNRPPRLRAPRRTTAYTLPAEPTRPERTPFPLAMMLVPVLMGVVLYLVTRSAYSLLFLGMSPLMALAGFATGSRQQRRRWRAEVREHARRSGSVRRAAQDALVTERAARRTDHPDAATLLLTGTGPRARLWERRREDADLLVVRVGTADQPSEVTLQDPAREAHEGPLTWTAVDAPVVLALAGSARVTGIAGDDDARSALARWVVGQAVVLHSPADLGVVVLGGPGAALRWSWLRWLPHAAGGPGAGDRPRVADDEASTTQLVAGLLDEVERRLAARSGNRPSDETPLLVVLDGARRLRLLGGVADLLRRGPAVGLSFVCLDADARLLPEECGAVVDLDAGTVRASGAAVVEEVRGEGVPVAWAERVARALAPVRDVTDPGTDRLPRSSRLLDLLGGPVSGEAVREAWARCPRSSAAVLGEAEDGPLVVDLVRDGPHALVAGTTGAGKSELLQSLVTSLALGNRPDELAFVLVDYKGGAAFADCAGLPHTVGLVTDLDGHLTARALDSLGAELRRREDVLARAGAKDLEAYAERRGPDDPPVARLVIVVDEFAALVAELPDFVTGLVDIARRGRSLGVHLVLATQRPAGVVSAEIRANTALRIALRVTDAADSQDVIDTADAVHVPASAPGRGYVRLGTAAPVPFQAARVGGRGPRAATGPPVRVAPAWSVPALPGADVGRPDGPSDLARVVTALQEAARGGGVRLPGRPWLPPLPATVTVDDLDADHGGGPSRLPIGLADVPSEQRREGAVLELAAGRHLGVLGGPRSGRSTVLRTVAGAVGRWTSPEDVHVHAVDCGANALLPLVALPHVGVVVTRDQPERMGRLVERLRRLVAERQQALAAAGFADVAEQRAAVPAAERMAYVVVLIDRWEGLVAAYDGVDGGALVTAWQQLLQEGGAVGLTAVVTGDRTLGVGRMAALLDDRLVLRMPDPGDFASIGLTTKQVPATMGPGRGFRAAGLRETQVALLAPDASGAAQVAALQRTAREAAARWADVPAERGPFHLDVLPARIGLEQALALDDDSPRTDLAVAVGGDRLALRGLDPLRHGPGLLVAGPRHSGRSTALRTMATLALRRGWEVVVVTPRTSPLRGLCEQPGVHGPYDAATDPDELEGLLARRLDDSAPHLVVVDDLELLGADGRFPALLERHLAALRDTGSVLVGAGSPSELGSVYRGPVVGLRRSGSGLLLWPQSSADADLYAARLPRSALGQVLPPGGGYLVTAGRTERVQVVWPG